MKPKCIICKNENVRVIYSSFPGYVENSFYDIYKCESCRTHFILTQDNLSSLYEKIYALNSVPGYDRYFKYAQTIKKISDPLKYLAYQESTYFPVYEYLKNKKKLKILEVGCGLGYLTYALNKKGMDIIGIDISGEAIEYASANFGDFFKKSDIESFGFNDNKFDVVIATELIEHLKDPFDFIKKCQKHLTESGVILLTTPNKDYYPANHIWNTDRPPVHISWLTHKAFNYIAQKCSMKVNYSNFRGYNPSYENRLFKFIRTRKDNPGVTNLTVEGIPKAQEKSSALHRFLLMVVHKFFLIRFPSNLIYNLFLGEEKTLGVILQKEK